MYSLSYEEFCWALTTNANNILLKRGFMHHFEIDASNQEVIRSYSCILQGFGLQVEYSCRYYLCR